MNIGKAVSAFLKDNESVILTSASVVGVLTSVTLAIQATPRALDAIVEKENEIGRPLFPKEIVENTWRVYVPTFVAVASTVSLIVLHEKRNSQKVAALMGAYAVLDNKHSLYREKISEKLGEKADRETMDEVSTSLLDKAGEASDDKTFLLGTGNSLIYEPLSGRYFRGSIEDVRRAVNSFNKELIDDTWADLNTFYSLLGLESTDMGGVLGWTVDDLMEVEYTSKVTPSGEPCLVITQMTNPRQDYYHNIP